MLPCSLLPIPCSLFGVPCSVFPVPYSLLPIPCPLVQPEPVALGIVGENLAISTPIQGRLDLLLGFVLGEVFLQEVAKEFQWHGVVQFTLQTIVYLLEQCDISEYGLTE